MYSWIFRIIWNFPDPPCHASLTEYWSYFLALGVGAPGFISMVIGRDRFTAVVSFITFLTAAVLVAETLAFRTLSPMNNAAVHQWTDQLVWLNMT